MDLHLPRVEFTSKLPPLATTQQQTNSSASASIIFIADHCSARSMLRSFDVWKRIESMRLVRYRCFEDTSTGKFCVQSADFFDAPIRPEQLMHSEKQFLN